MSSVAEFIKSDYKGLVLSKLPESIKSGFKCESLNVKLFPFQKHVTAWALELGRAAVFLDTGLGKAQPLDEPVLTPKGYVCMGDIKLNDYVISADGKPTRVLAIYPQGMRDTYEVKFNDGSKTRCDIDHLWLVNTDLRISRGHEWQVFSLRDLLKKGITHHKVNRLQWRIPMSEPVELEAQVLPINPYILGVLLGDGCLTLDGVVMSIGDKEIVSHISTKLENTSLTLVQEPNAKCNYRISNIEHKYNNCYLDALRDLGLDNKYSHEKFIPSQYLKGSLEQRIELLQGLMDTDGYVLSGANTLQYSSSSPRLIEDVRQLVMSLGGNARLTSKIPFFTYKGEKKKGLRSYTLTLRLPASIKPFTEPTKASNYKPNEKYLPQRKISEVNYLGKMPTQCIAVENPSHTYVTRDYVVTHNTRVQIEWAYQVYLFTGQPVLIVTPLAVAQQFIKEGKELNYELHYCRSQDEAKDKSIVITNYEMLKAFDLSSFVGVSLDESSILKSFAGKTKSFIIDSFSKTPYRLAATATPSPNDYSELANHAEFLGVATNQEVMAEFFINDLGDTTSGFRLKKHAERDWWKWVSTWAVAAVRPSDLGVFDDTGYELPELVLEHTVLEVDHSQAKEGMLFRAGPLSATKLHEEGRMTAGDKAAKIAELTKDGNSWVIWCNTNYEQDAIKALLPDALDLRGNAKPDDKIAMLEAFHSGENKILLTKASITGYGLNWQFVNHTAFFGGSSYSFEMFYQAVRRFWRFGQTKPVYAHVVSAESEQSVMLSIWEKQKQFTQMQEAMVANMTITEQKAKQLSTSYDHRIERGSNWELHNGDCVEVMATLPDESIHFSIHSPPFSDLFVYSDSAYDMGNNKDDAAFIEQYRYAVKELYRLTKGGRLAAVHCADIIKTKTKYGHMGLRDFSGMVVRLFEEEGWILHSKITIWKDPVVQMQRTKQHSLLHKNFKERSESVTQGLPDYLCVFRKWTDEQEDKQVQQDRQPGDYIGTEPPFDYENNRWYSIQVWQRYASPVWFDIDQSRTLNYKAARDNKDERHICPLQLDVIGRAIDLWTNEGDTVFSPFAGIGSEVYEAVRMRRKGLGVELKPSYFDLAVKHVKEAEMQSKQVGLFEVA